jgi:hypothetical protein
MNESFGKIDIIIIIILALLVAFIIGFNIIQIIDNKLSSVIINVPPQNCTLPQILVNFDKDNKPIKLNHEQLNIINQKINPESEISNKFEGFASGEFNNSTNSIDSAELDQTVKTFESESEPNDHEHFGNVVIRENYGSLPDKYEHRNDEHINIFAQRTSSDLGSSLINNPDKINVQDKNYNTIDNYPYLIDPDNSKEGYYQSRVKLVSDSSSPLLKLEEKNMEKINQVINSCIKNQPVQEIDATYDGYNQYPNLQTGSFANFTSIGKSLLTPYTSYPVPS